MANLRSWTWIDENKLDEAEQERLRPVLDELARQWSELNTASEQRGWDRQRMIEDGDGPDFDTDEEFEEFKKEERQRGLVHETKVKVIEDMLAELGARMMRPYEHWNEDERLMAYLERDRD